MPLKTFFTIATSLIAVAAAAAAPLTVSVDGVEARGGTFYVSVQTEEEFMQDAGTAGDVIAGPSEGAFVSTYSVPAGAYAITVWHDENSNGVFDTEENGMPLDGWAMSGGALTGPPNFSDVAVEVPADGATVELRMTYHR